MHRVQFCSTPAIESRAQHDLATVVSAMNKAATQDLRPVAGTTLPALPPRCSRDGAGSERA